MADPAGTEIGEGTEPKMPAKARLTASIRRIVLKKESAEEIGKKTDVEKGKVWKSHANK
ncbi:MAG: hypothetical protein MUE55_07810 [Thermoplasmata archaeon]|nr:hypothetical protein [Thermoplasmata archaeon]